MFKCAWQRATTYSNYWDVAVLYDKSWNYQRVRDLLLVVIPSGFQQIWLIQSTYHPLIEFVSLFLFHHFGLWWNSDRDCIQPRMWGFPSHWMRHISQVIPVRWFSWWQLTPAGARRENSTISQLSDVCDNNNLIWSLREELRLSFCVFAKKHAARGLAID